MALANLETFILTQDSVPTLRLFDTPCGGRKMKVQPSSCPAVLRRLNKTSLPPKSSHWWTPACHRGSRRAMPPTRMQSLFTNPNSVARRLSCFFSLARSRRRRRRARMSTSSGDVLVRATICCHSIPTLWCIARNVRHPRRRRPARGSRGGVTYDLSLREACPSSLS